uniref:Glycosyltransferase family 92 protein n=1 Tax=Aureoumbra lagunensis TaxID=44058 RepID=A0A7S3JYV6_9STRA
MLLAKCIVLLGVWCINSVPQDYYLPYARYGLPRHVLDDVRIPTGAKRARACALPNREDYSGVPYTVPEFYFFAFVRDDEAALLAHFFRWYQACGLDLQNHSHFVVHRVGTDSEQIMSQIEFDRAGIPKKAIEIVHSYSSRLKAQKVNAYLDTIPQDAWLVYPDADEFFAFPCDWGGRILPILDHLRKAQNYDAAYAVSIVASRDEYKWLRKLSAPPAFYNTTPWVSGFDFVGGEMIDRVANDWSLPNILPPRLNTSKPWTRADIGDRSIFQQFPIPVRATSCLFHARPFKQILTRASCHFPNQAKQRFESSHRTSCFVHPFHQTAARRKTPPPLPPGFNATIFDTNTTLLRRKKPPAIYPKTYAFPHFRFSAHASKLADEKRKAYEISSAKLAISAASSDATIADKIAKANVDHARLAYTQASLYFYSKNEQQHFRPEVRLVLELDCSGDRYDRDAAYSQKISGRLDDLKRRKFLKVLALESRVHQSTALASFFRSFYANSDTKTKASKDQLRRLSFYLTASQETPHWKRRRQHPQQNNEKFPATTALSAVGENEKQHLDSNALNKWRRQRRNQIPYRQNHLSLPNQA